MLSIAARPSESQIWDTRRLWSLWDMINFTIEGTIKFLEMLEQVSISSAVMGREQPDSIVSASEKERIWKLIEFAVTKTTAQELEATYMRLERVGVVLRSESTTYQSVAREMSIVRETAEDELRHRYFYYYKRDKARKLNAFPGEWAPSNNAFKSGRDDALAAVDCYAMDHGTACVFHCMRVLEHGLRALAKNVGLTFDTQQWKTIIDNIETKIESIRDNGIPGMEKAAKDARLQFLSEAARDFFYFKDGWRNYVSHGKAKYDEYQALGVLEHTRTFMNHLSTQLSE